MLRLAGAIRIGLYPINLVDKLAARIKRCVADETWKGAKSRGI